LCNSGRLPSVTTVALPFTFGWLFSNTRGVSSKSHGLGSSLGLTMIRFDSNFDKVRHKVRLYTFFNTHTHKHTPILTLKSPRVYPLDAWPYGYSLQSQNTVMTGLWLQFTNHVGYGTGYSLQLELWIVVQATGYSLQLELWVVAQATGYNLSCALWQIP
jgi:hypothetical protein